MAQNFDTHYREAALSAYRKIEGVLPEHLRSDVQYLRDSIRFVASGIARNEPERAKLQQIRRSIIDCNRIRFRYYKRRNRDDDSTLYREADPYGLVFILNTWHLSAYCHLRKDVRIFRLDRMDDLEVLPQTFQRPTDFQLREPDLKMKEQARTIVVRVLFDPSITRWVRESRSFYTIAEEETPDGLLVTLRIRHEDEVLQWLLGWGSRARVLEPQLLRTRLAEEAQAVLHVYQEVGTPEAAQR